MTTPKKAAARKLGPTSDTSSQPPWAMIAPDGEIYFPKSADEARSFAGEHGALPVSPELWPWQADAPMAELSDLALREQLAPADPIDVAIEQQQAADPPAAPVTTHTVTINLDGQQIADTMLPPAQSPAAPPEAVLGGLVTSCPQPALCFPLGLPDNCSYATCVHGAWTIGD